MPAPAELVGVVDAAAAPVGGAQQPQRLRRAADMDVQRLPLGGPRDVVVAGAPDRADRRRHARPGTAPCSAGCRPRPAPATRPTRREPALRPRVPVVVDHHRDHVPLRGRRTTGTPVSGAGTSLGRLGRGRRRSSGRGLGVALGEGLGRRGPAASAAAARWPSPATVSRAATLCRWVPAAEGGRQQHPARHRRWRSRARQGAGQRGGDVIA